MIRLVSGSVCLLTHAEVTSLLVFVTSLCDVLSLCGQDAAYQSLQSVVDWFRELVGIPLEKRYNTVLFGGSLDDFTV